MDERKGRNWFVDALCVFFGMGAWISVNGMWVELPLLVQTLPEGWALPSYMSIVIQIANVGPIAYSVARLAVPRLADPVRCIYALMAIGVTSSLLMVLFWNSTSTLGESQHSTAMLSLLFFLSLVDCTSSVLFMPFMARFRRLYLTSYLIGEGLSGFLPSLFALSQGVGGNPECRNISGQIESYYPPPRYSVSQFFMVLLALMVTSATAFLLLHKTSAAARERVDGPKNTTTGRCLSSIDNVTFVASSDDPEGDRGAHSLGSSSTSAQCSKRESFEDSNLSSTTDDVEHVVDLPLPTLLRLLVIQAWVCALSNGFLPSIQSYSSLPYGNVAYHLAVTLSSMANPVACLVAYFVPVTKLLIIIGWTTVGTCISSYIIALALLSPNPFMVDSSAGEALMVIAWVLSHGVLTYVKVSIAAILCRQVAGQRNLFWFGVSTQIGSAVGSVIAFVLVNVLFLFQSYYPCA